VTESQLPRLLTYQQVGDLLGKSPDTVSQLVTDSKLAALNVNGKPRVLESEYLRYVESLSDWNPRRDSPKSEVEPEPTAAAHDIAWFAARINMSEDWVRRNTHQIPHRIYGRRVRFTEDDVRIFLDQHAIDPMRVRRTERSRRRKS